jgi:hypothetical protein
VKLVKKPKNVGCLVGKPNSGSVSALYEISLIPST